jgi:hypothetical protein
MVNKLMIGHPIDVEVASLEIGDQIADEWVTLEGVTYDRIRDVVHVQTDPVDHLIPRPKEIGVEQVGMEIRTIVIRNAWGELQILRFREPLLLPAARGR